MPLLMTGSSLFSYPTREEVIDYFAKMLSSALVSTICDLRNFSASSSIILRNIKLALPFFRALWISGLILW